MRDDRQTDNHCVFNGSFRKEEEKKLDRLLSMHARLASQGPAVSGIAEVALRNMTRERPRRVRPHLVIMPSIWTR